jgi:hypothetical protein
MQLFLKTPQITIQFSSIVERFKNIKNIIINTLNHPHLLYIFSLSCRSSTPTFPDIIPSIINLTPTKLILNLNNNFMLFIQKYLVIC